MTARARTFVRCQAFARHLEMLPHEVEVASDITLHLARRSTR